MRKFKFVKSLCALILAACLILAVTACDMFEDVTESQKIQRMSDDIIACLVNRDKEGFKNLFCEQAKSAPGFDSEVDAAFEFLQVDEYVSSFFDPVAGGGSTFEPGERIAWYVLPEIAYLHVKSKVNSGSGAEADNETVSKYYSIFYYWQIVLKADPTRVGLHYLEIELLNISSITVGAFLSSD